MAAEKSIYTLKNYAAKLISDFKSVRINLIIITEDSLKVCINEKISILDRNNYWKILLPIFISLDSSNLIVTFTEKYGIPATTWQLFFNGFFVFVGFLLLISIVYRLFYAYNLDNLIHDINQKTIINERINLILETVTKLEFLTSPKSDVVLFPK